VNSILFFKALLSYKKKFQHPWNEKCEKTTACFNSKIALIDVYYVTFLRVDFDSMKRSQLPDEKRFIMKSVPLPVNTKFKMEHTTAMSAVSKLLKALIEPDEPSGSGNMIWMQTEKAKKSGSSSSSSSSKKEKFTATNEQC
jgi:hypothetical protein